MIGVFATGICAAKATLKAKEEVEKLEEPTTFEKFKVAAPIYGPCVAIGGATVACIPSQSQDPCMSRARRLHRLVRQSPSCLLDLWQSPVQQLLLSPASLMERSKIFEGS